MSSKQRLLAGGLALLAMLPLGCELEDGTGLETTALRRTTKATDKASSTDTQGSIATVTLVPPTPLPPPAPPRVSSLEISAATLRLAQFPRFDARGDRVGLATSAQLSAVVRYQDGSSNGMVVWSSSDPSVATVTESGVIQVMPAMPRDHSAITVITASALADPRSSAGCRVTIEP